MSEAGSSRPRVAGAPLLFLVAAVVASGAAALVYETIWTRAFAIILGSTVQAASATFAAFLVGLAAGAWLFGRREVPLRFTVHLYLALELGIAMAAPAVGLLIHQHADGLAVWIGAGVGPRVVSSFATVLGLVLVPTLLMGATFPFMLNIARRAGAPITVIGRLYGFNTLGAAAGTLVCGFFLIRLLGVPGSLWVGAGLNCIAALCCVPLLRTSMREPGGHETPLGETSEPGQAGRLTPAALLAIAAMSGLLILGLEIVWTRLASYFLGNRTYAFTTLLACVLLLLAVGSGLSARLVARFGSRPRSLFGWTLTAASALTVLGTATAWWWIGQQSAIEPELPGAGRLLLLHRALETLVLLAPTLVPLGCLFPMSLMCSRLARRRVGRAAGQFYLANTAGSVVGSLGVGFWGVSTLGAFGCVALLAALGALLAAWLFALEARRSGSRVALAGLVCAALAGLSAPLILPGTLTLLAEEETLVFRREDEYGVMQVVRRPDGLLKVTNNRTELIYHLGRPITSYVQQMQGHLGMFHHPRARSALVLGSGYGITAGALATYPQLERIDAVEIIPGMFEAADLFRPYNLDYHRDPRVHRYADDGRHFLARSDRSYDVISINVSDAHIPGSSALFHKDFYEVVKKHLKPGGVVIQHAFGQDKDIVLRTLLHCFQDVRALRAYANGYNVLASDRILDGTGGGADRLMEIASVRTALSSIGLLPPLMPSGLISAAIQRDEIEARLGLDGPIATDDHPTLEFAWSTDTSLILFSNE